MDGTIVGKSQLVKRQLLPLASKIVRWQCEDVPQTLADRIKEARKAKGLGIVQLDQEAQVSQGTVTRYEKGQRGVGSGGDGETLRKLAKALGVRVDWLLTGEGPMVDAPRTDDPLPRRTEAARIAREDGVYERGIESVLEEPAPPGAETKSTLWWANRMQARALELYGKVPAPKGSTPPASHSRPTPLPPPSPKDDDEQPAKPHKKRAG